jgi:putative transposase
MLTATNLLPNHIRGLYREMKEKVEDQHLSRDFKRFVKTIYETSILEEFDHDVIGVDDFVRSEARKNSRNGFYQRSLETVHGFIEQIRIPRPRQGGFTPRCLQKHGRREAALNRLISECFFRGISTRDVGRVVEALSGSKLSSTTVSRLTNQWQAEVTRWHQRKLADNYIYLMFDGIWIKNRSMGNKRRLILVAYGISGDGKREIIDYTFARSESTENWQVFLNNLMHRGIHGRNLQLITTDGCRGLANAIDMVFPMTPHQLCWAHKMRNILSHVKQADFAKVKSGLSKLFRGDHTKASALKVINSWRSRWKSHCPDAVRCLERDLERLLPYLDCPLEHHVAVRTSNHIERQFKEYRRRMRPMEIIPTKDSADKILFALTMYRNEKLMGYPVNFTQKTLH